MFPITRAIADDKKNRDYLQPRNLNFESHIAEINCGLEYDLFDIEKTPFTPYFFSGIGVFHFDPFTYDKQGKKFISNHLAPKGRVSRNIPPGNLIN